MENENDTHSVGLILIVITLVVGILGFVLLINFKPIKGMERYVDWDAWEKEKANCNKPVMGFIENNSLFCNPNTNECMLRKLEYEAIYWKSIVCSDNVKIEDFERLK